MKTPDLPARWRAWSLFAALLWAPLLPAQAPVEVELRAVSELARPAPGQASATVLSPNDSLLAAELTAVVARVAAEVGASVRKGELLVELDATDVRLALAQAEAQIGAAKARLTLAEQRFERAGQLKEREFVSADDLLARSAELAAAKAELGVLEANRRIAARQVDKARILAPFDGVVVERHAQLGALATPGTALLRLVDLGQAEVEAALQELDAQDIASAAALRFDSQGRSWPLRLLRLAAVADPASRTRIARFAFADGAAAAGNSGVLSWQGSRRLLPPELLVRRGDALGVFVAEDGRARFVSAPGAQEGRAFATGLAPSALLIVRGHQALNDGQPIQARSAADD